MEVEDSERAMDSGGTTLPLEGQQERDTQIDRRETWETKDDKGEK